MPLKLMIQVFYYVYACFACMCTTCIPGASHTASALRKQGAMKWYFVLLLYIQSLISACEMGGHI